MPEDSHDPRDHPDEVGAREWRPLVPGFRWRPTGPRGRAGVGVEVLAPRGVVVTIGGDGTVTVAAPGGEVAR